MTLHMDPSATSQHRSSRRDFALRLIAISSAVLVSSFHGTVAQDLIGPDPLNPEPLNPEPTTQDNSPQDTHTSETKGVRYFAPRTLDFQFGIK